MSTSTSDSVPMIRVYRFGGLGPIEGAAAVIDQMQQASGYYNALVEIENWRRLALREIVDRGGDIALLEAERCAADLWVETVAARLKEERVLRRGRVVPKEFKTALAAAKQERAVISALLAHSRRCSWLRITHERRDPRVSPADPSILLAVENEDEDVRVGPAAEIAAIALDKVKDARRHSSPYWGTYLLIEIAVEAAKDATPFWRDLAFRHFNGDGTVSVQIQNQKQRGDKPFTTDRIFNSTDTRVRVAPIDETIWREPMTRKVKSGRDPRQRTTLSLRVGSDGRSPVWAKFPILMHRPLPDGIIKRVSVSRREVDPGRPWRIIGSRERWSVEITVEEAPKKRALVVGPDGPGGDGVVALHLGWYAESSTRVRVATWMDEHGNAGYIHVPTPPDHHQIAAMRNGRDLVDGFEKASHIQGTRSKNFDVVRDLLADWFDANAAIIPDWLSSMRLVKYLRLCRSKGKLARLCWAWQQARFTGDDDAFLGLETWRRQDNHLMEWWRAQLNHAQNYRKNAYRVAVAKLSKTYRTIVLDSVDLRRFARTKKNLGEDLSKSEFFIRDETDENRRRAAPSELRNCAINAFLARRGEVMQVHSAYESIECPKCHAVHEAHAHVEAHHFACSMCTFDDDLDTVALLNMLRRAGRDDQVATIIARWELHRSRSVLAEKTGDQ